MDKYIPINKQSKKQKKGYYSKYRNTWNALIRLHGQSRMEKVIIEKNKSRKIDGAAGYLSIRMIPAASPLYTAIKKLPAKKCDRKPFHSNNYSITNTLRT